ncbi:MAG TPA: hypothetical protein VG605_09400 [Puia sp.]|nr:hypothetical protein [Puia sp.]
MSNEENCWVGISMSSDLANWQQLIVHDISPFLYRWKDRLIGFSLNFNLEHGCCMVLSTFPVAHCRDLLLTSAREELPGYQLEPFAIPPQRSPTTAIISQWISDNMVTVFSSEPISKESIDSYYSYMLLAALHALLPDTTAAVDALSRLTKHLQQFGDLQDRVHPVDERDLDCQYVENETFFSSICRDVWSYDEIRHEFPWLESWSNNILTLKEAAPQDQLLQQIIALLDDHLGIELSNIDKYALLTTFHQSLRRFVPKVIPNAHNATITAILTVWKREHLSEQLRVLGQQSHPPEHIWVYHCGSHQPPDYSLLDHYPNLYYQYNTSDLGYFGRFNLALFAKTDYIFIMDDDVVPSAHWLEKGMQLCSAHQSIVSPAGRIIPPGSFRPEEIRDPRHVQTFYIGDGDAARFNRCFADSFVDYGCNSWLLKAEWMTYFWSIKPYTLETGEDIHLSAAAFMQGGVRTICPRQEEFGLCGNLKKAYGLDEHASWRRPDFADKREKIFTYWIKEKGWKPVYWR